MRNAKAGPRAHLLSSAMVLLALSIRIAGTAFAQTPASATNLGLPPPDIAATASLSAALAELDRSAGTVVAEVGGQSVTWGDIADAIRAMPPIVSAIPFQKLYQNATVQVMQQKALVKLGETTGLDKDPVVRRRMKNAAEQLMVTEVLRRSLAPNITDKALRAVYDGVIAGQPGPDEVRARIIMTESKQQSADLISRLQAGEDFGTLAQKFSADATAGAGGDLGYARLDMLAPEIGAVVFALGVGQISAFPIRSGEYWFIVRVDGRRQPSTPGFEEAKPGLERDIIHAGVPELMRLALKQADVKYHGLTGRKEADTASK